MPKVYNDGIIRVQLSYNPDKEPDIHHYIVSNNESSLTAYLKKCIRAYEESRQKKENQILNRLDKIMAFLQGGVIIQSSVHQKKIEEMRDDLFEDALNQI